jgi:hypothetical protein
MSNGGKLPASPYGRIQEDLVAEHAGRKNSNACLCSSGTVRSLAAVTMGKKGNQLVFG